MDALIAESSQAPCSLRQHLAERLGHGFGIACTGVDGDPQRLYPEEFAFVRQAVSRRQREFAAGRQAARQAMMAIGWPPVAIPSASDRSPVWPEGLVGSISHTSRSCVAVVCPSHHARGIGIDLEHDLPMEPELWGTICVPHERAWVTAQTVSLQGLWVTRLFSAKEAYFKWQYPQTGQMLDFQDVHVDFDIQSMGFDIHSTAVNKSDILPLHVSGELLIGNGEMLALVTESFRSRN